MKKLLLLIPILIIASLTVSALQVSISEYDPTPAQAGKFVNVWFKIENIAQDNVDNVEIEINPQDGLELTDGENAKKRLGTINGRSTEKIQYRLKVNKDAFEGPNNIEVKLIEGGGSTSRDLALEVIEKETLEVDLQIGDIQSDPRRIKPGDEFIKLDIVLQNLGSGRAVGVKAELINLPTGITLSESYSGTSLLGNIESDATATGTFFIDVTKTTQPGEYTANIKLSYKYKPDQTEDAYLFEETKLPMKISLRAIPLYDIIAAEFLPGNLSPGKKDIALRITIQNIGKEEGKAVRIKAFTKTEQPFSFDDSSDFISPLLKPGQTGQGTLVFDINDDANLQTYQLDLEIKNLVGDDIITYNDVVDIPILTPKEDNPWKYAKWGIYALIVIIILQIVRRLNKRFSQKAEIL